MASDLLYTAAGNAFRVQLGQYRDHLLHLKTRWSNPLASSVRYDSHILEASSTASRLTGHSQPLFRWAYVTNTAEGGLSADAQDDQDELDENLPQHELLARDVEEGAIVVSAIFERDESDDEDDVPPPSSPLVPPTQYTTEENNDADPDIIFLDSSFTKKTEREDASTNHSEGAIAISLCWTRAVRFNYNNTIVNKLTFRLEFGRRHWLASLYRPSESTANRQLFPGPLATLSSRSIRPRFSGVADS